MNEENIFKTFMTFSITAFVLIGAGLWVANTRSQLIKERHEYIIKNCKSKNTYLVRVIERRGKHTCYGIYQYTNYSCPDGSSPLIRKFISKDNSELLEDSNH